MGCGSWGSNSGLQAFAASSFNSWDISLAWIFTISSWKGLLTTCIWYFVDLWLHVHPWLLSLHIDVPWMLPPLSNVSSPCRFHFSDKWQQSTGVSIAPEQLVIYLKVGNCSSFICVTLETPDKFLAFYCSFDFVLVIFLDLQSSWDFLYINLILSFLCCF